MININIKLDIYDNASGDFQLQTGLQKDYNSRSFNKNLGYMDHCSAKCSANDPETKKKHIKTCLEKYGETNYSKTNELLIIDTNNF